MLTYAEIDALAESRYRQDAYDLLEEKVFGLLVDVADRYLTLLEEHAADEPAPYFAGATPMQAAINGLRENLDLKRDGTLPQHR